MGLFVDKLRPKINPISRVRDLCTGCCNSKDLTLTGLD